MEDIKKKEEELDLISNNRFIVDTDNVFNVPYYYVSGVVFKPDNSISLYLKDDVIYFDGYVKSIMEIIRNHKNIFDMKITYLDKCGLCKYSEIFESSIITSVFRNPINYDNSSLSLIYVDIKYKTIDYDYDCHNKK